MNQCVGRGIKIRAVYGKFKVFMFVYWAMMLGIIGMYALYMLQSRYSKTEISYAASILVISTMIGQNVTGFLADRFRCVKPILIVFISIGAAASVLLHVIQQRWYIYIAVCLWGIFLYGTSPLSEAWYIKVLRDNGDQREFGKIRGMGSVGYGLSGILIGFLLQRFGWGVYVWYILASACVLLVVIFNMEDSGQELFQKAGEDNGGNCTKITYREALIQIKQIKPLWHMIIIIFMYSFALKGIYIYMGVLVSDAGGGPLSMGFTMFFDAAPELVTFFLAARLLVRYRIKGLIFGAFLLQILRLFLILVFRSPISIMMLGVLSGFSYGLLAATYKTYIYELAPEKYKTCCMGLSESIIGFSGVISVPVFGFVIMKFGGYASIAMGLVINIGAALIMAASLMRDNKKRAGNETKQP